MKKMAAKGEENGSGISIKMSKMAIMKISSGENGIEMAKRRNNEISNGTYEMAKWRHQSGVKASAEKPKNNENGGIMAISWRKQNSGMAWHRGGNGNIGNGVMAWRKAIISIIMSIISAKIENNGGEKRIKISAASMASIIRQLMKMA